MLQVIIKILNNKNQYANFIFNQSIVEMASNRRGNTNSLEEGNTSAHNQTTARVIFLLL